jgi:hypothetical protein
MRHQQPSIPFLWVGIYARVSLLLYEGTRSRGVD